MERVDIEVNDLFLDDRKAEYIRTAHNVHRDDVFMVFYDRPRYFRKVSEKGARYSMLARPAEGAFW